MFITVVAVGNVFKGVCQSFCSRVGRVSLVPRPFQAVGYPGGQGIWGGRFSGRGRVSWERVSGRYCIWVVGYLGCVIWVVGYLGGKVSWG